MTVDQTTPITRGITIDDVRTAIQGIDPNSTNAYKVRGLLGNRGSNETIQRHLDTIRAELAASLMPVADLVVPAAPKDAAEAIWHMAYIEACKPVLARTERLAAERDAALLRVNTLESEATAHIEAHALTQELLETSQLKEQAAVDSLEREVAEVMKLMEQQVGDLSAASHALRDAAAERDALVSRAQSDMQRVTESHSQQRDLMRVELARLTDQVAELKAHLYQRAAAGTNDAVVSPVAKAKPAKKEQ